MVMTHQARKQCYSKQDRSGSFMINGVKKLEFIVEISVAHTETINPIYWAPTTHQPKKPRNFRKKQYCITKHLFLTVFLAFKKRKKTNKQTLKPPQNISPIYQEIFWV